MRALLILAIICVIGWLWMRRPAAPPAAARPPATQRPISSLDPKSAMDRAAAVTEQVKKKQDEEGVVGRK